MALNVCSKIRIWWWVKIRKRVKVMEAHDSEKPGYRVIKED